MVTAFPHRLGVSQAVKKEFSNIVTMWVVLLLLLLIMPIALIAAACHATACVNIAAQERHDHQLEHHTALPGQLGRAFR